MIDHLRFRASPHDARDHVFRAEPLDLPPQVDLRAWDSLVESQGQLNSCAGNAMTNCYELMVRQKYPDRFAELSRLYVYYYTRLLENRLDEDDGVLYIRNMLRAVQHYGLCREDLWPYDEDLVNTEPSAAAQEDARQRTITEYCRVRARTDIMTALARGYPVIVGLEIFLGFQEISESNPVVAMPDEKIVSLGGHAVAIVGYDQERQQYLIKNSFGTSWGQEGYAWITFGYADLYAFDSWIFDINDQITATVPSSHTRHK
jgi:C1A family cysteine protease